MSNAPPSGGIARVGNRTWRLEPITVRPSRGWPSLDLDDFWRHRDLLWLLSLRQVKIRFRRTSLSLLWAIVPPAMMALVFTGLLRALDPSAPGVGTDGARHGVMTFGALVLWQSFARVVAGATGSLSGNRHLITKVYFPRLILPFTPVLPAVVDLVLGFVVFMVAAAFTGMTFTARLAVLPACAGLILLSAVGVGVWLASLTAVWREFENVSGLLIQIAMFASPVIYDATAVANRLPPWLQLVHSLNPIAVSMQGMRWALQNSAPPSLVTQAASVVLAAAVLITGAIVFRRLERVAVDTV